MSSLPLILLKKLSLQGFVIYIRSDSCKDDLKTDRQAYCICLPFHLCLLLCRKFLFAETVRTSTRRWLRTTVFLTPTIFHIAPHQLVFVLRVAAPLNDPRVLARIEVTTVVVVWVAAAHWTWVRALLEFFDLHYQCQEFRFCTFWIIFFAEPSTLVTCVHQSTTILLYVFAAVDMRSKYEWLRLSKSWVHLLFTSLMDSLNSTFDEEKYVLNIYRMYTLYFPVPSFRMISLCVSTNKE